MNYVGFAGLVEFFDPNLSMSETSLPRNRGSPTFPKRDLKVVRSILGIVRGYRVESCFKRICLTASGTSVMSYFVKAT